MSLSNLKSLNQRQINTLFEESWTVEQIATAKIKNLTGYSGIGKVTAEKVIEEAALLVNAQGLEEAEKLSIERYYQKTPPWKIIADWEMAGLSLEDVALSSVEALSILKGINEDLASKCITIAQTKVNDRKLIESQQMFPLPGGGASLQEATPSNMSVRVQRANG